MPRFYFIVHDEAGESPDCDGAELPDLEAALLHAAAGARSMMRDSIGTAGALDLTAYIRIEDMSRKPVARLNFVEAVKIRE